MSDTGEANRARGRNAGGRAADPSDPGRRTPDAASVSVRWWEQPAPSTGPTLPLFQTAQSSFSGAPAGVTPPPPPPQPEAWSAVPPPSPQAPASQQNPVTAELRAADAARIQRLEQELAAARDEATALHEMLEDLPEIFEHKFRQRLGGILEQQQLLMADNRLLREQLFALQPADPGRSPTLLLPPSPSGGGDADAGGAPLRRVLHGVRRLGRRLRSRRLGGWNGGDDLSDRDDGRPTAA